MLLPPSVRIYVALDPVDMRCGHDGLAAIVRNEWKLDLYSGHLFVFAGKRGDRIKILFFDRGGFVVYYKPLEKGRFRIAPMRPGATSVEMDAAGIDVSRVERPKLWSPGSFQRRPHRNRSTRSVRSAPCAPMSFPASLSLPHSQRRHSSPRDGQPQAGQQGGFRNFRGRGAEAWWRGGGGMRLGIAQRERGLITSAA